MLSVPLKLTQVSLQSNHRFIRHSDYGYPTKIENNIWTLLSNMSKSEESITQQSVLQVTQGKHNKSVIYKHFNQSFFSDFGFVKAKE